MIITYFKGKRLLCVLIIFCTIMHSSANEKNLTSITWSHATNSKALLDQVLNSDIDFIEADIMYGYLKNDETRDTKQPIMAHPTDEEEDAESDLSLKNFMTRIWEFNEKVAQNKQKGVKLDFKSTEVFEKSLEILNEMWNPKYQVWLNADIYSGPVDSKNRPVDPISFITNSKKFENAVLSCGWTTRWGPDFKEGSYSLDQIKSMINGIKNNDVKNDITFPVRAGIAAQSLDSLAELFTSLNTTNVITFTIWSSENDNVDVENLRKFIFKFGIDKVYIDVPDDLLDQLNLHKDGSLSIRPLSLAVLLVAFVFLKFVLN